MPFSSYLDSNPQIGSGQIPLAEQTGMFVSSPVLMLVSAVGHQTLHQQL